ncbi:hypothetical protein LDENG_00037560 [Lucifuga dentata]|nr:hypothetical protein LDENG_00037560 [Lucifuga dentata]
MRNTRSFKKKRAINLIMSRNYLSRNDELRRGDFLMSNNKEWKAIFQDDGNFVVYGWKPVWASDTHGSDVTRLCLQADCNLVMYNKEAEPQWHTDTWNCDFCDMNHLYLNDSGVLVLMREGKEIWTSAKNRGFKK